MLKSKDLAEQLQKQRREAEEKDAQRRAEKYGLDYLNLISAKVPSEIKAMMLVPEEEARVALLVPLQLVRKTLIVAAFDPIEPRAKKIIEELKKKYEVKVVVGSLSGLKHAWDYYQYIVPLKDISGSVNIDEAKLHETQSIIKCLDDLTKSIQDFKGPYTSQILEIILSGASAVFSVTC